MCWTILNRLLYKKILPTILPLLVDGKSVSDFCEKANIFNNFLASIIDNASCLPSFSYRTGSRINFSHVTENDILAVITLKAHDCNNISIKMVTF